MRLPTWVGDVVMVTPALAAMRAAHPEAEIVVEGKGFHAGLLGGLPSFDRFLTDPGKQAKAIWGHAGTLRAERFDLAVLFPDAVRSAVAPFLARIPRRIGYARDAVRRALLTDSLDVPREDGERVPIPMVERYLRVTRAAGCPDPADVRVQLAVDVEAAARVEARLAEHGLGETPGLVVASPGAAFGSSKLYPADQFAQACDGFRDRLGLVPVLAPGPGEEPLARKIAQAMSGRAVVLEDPITSLAELVALLARARLAFCNDTGPRHIAVAVGTPVVCVMGPTDPRHTAYQLEHQRVLLEDGIDCAPCHLKTCPIDHRCLTRLSPSRVVEAAAELLAAVDAAVDATGTMPA